MAIYDDLIIEREPPPKRVGTCIDGVLEKHFTEAAVMLAYAMHLFETMSGAHTVKVCPDGEHAKRFDIPAWLNAHSFHKIESIGSTIYGGRYIRGQQTILLTPTSGIGDVVIDVDGTNLLAECKGGIINSRHPGQKSKLRKGLCEAVGLLMASQKKGRQVAVVPLTETTLSLAKSMKERVGAAGIEIVLLSRDGSVIRV